MAATLAGCELDFSTFGTPDECDEILDTLEARRLLQATLLASTASLAGEDFVPRFKALLDPAAWAETVEAPVAVGD